MVNVLSLYEMILALLKYGLQDLVDLVLSFGQ